MKPGENWGLPTSEKFPVGIQPSMRVPPWRSTGSLHRDNKKGLKRTGQGAEDHDLLSPHQYGFRAGFSCTSQLIRLFHSWASALDKNKTSDVVFLDFEKAFDSVPHKHLISKLGRYGINGQILEWLGDFLQDRFQRVVLEGESSDWSMVYSGVPQGSIVGPMLFLLYVNDIPENLSCSSEMFADDTLLFNSDHPSSVHQPVCESLSQIVDWCKKWLLKLKATKSKCMKITRSRSVTPCSYNINSIPLEQVKTHKHLGVIISSDLSWKPHVLSVAAKANKILGLLKRTFGKSSEAISIGYKSMVRPIVEYACPVWNPHQQYLSDKLERVQRNASRWILGSSIDYSERLKYLSENKIEALPDKIFKGVKNLKALTVDTNLMCCHLTKETADCDYAYVDMSSFSSCETMFRNRAPRICLWVIGIMSLLGAVFVIVWRLVFKETKEKNKIQSIMLIHLAGSDGLMGIYLIIIGVMDAIWAGQYFLHDYNWRSSLSCQITGAIAVLSSEVSVMTICLISADRVKNIVFPYRGKSLTIKVTHLFCFLIWIVGGVTAFIPMVGIDYFDQGQKGHHFYGRSVVCLPLQLSADKPSGWEYSVAMFVGFNFTLVLFVIVAYSMIIYQSCTSNRRLAQQGTARERKLKAKQRAADLRREASLAKRVFFIVLTDCVCWLPIVVIGLRSLLENSFRAPGGLAVWIAVFVLPVNSAINPILYTLSTKQVRRILRPKFQQFLGYLLEKCGRNQNNEGQDEGMEMRVIEEVIIHREAESDDSDDSDDSNDSDNESKDQSEHEQNAEQTDHEQPGERGESEQDEKPEEYHEGQSEQKNEPKKREEEYEEQHEDDMEDEPDKQEEESKNHCKESKGQDEDDIDVEPDKQDEELKKDFEVSEKQDEDGMDEEAGEDERLIANK
ncbi:uncharacterized protein LOC111346476, partial [Stylophora pistillata]|uniref:uncharacterized protein LOC111346476 n=1 Tax=Stylophora pistillata TaxID=50429 RepID=UPI000C043FAB